MAIDVSKMSEIGGLVAEGMQSVLPMLLPKPVEISVDETEIWQPQAYPDPMVLVTTNLSDGPSGSLYFLLKTSGASSIVDLMLGGEGSAARSMNEESVDALKEVMNQVLGVTASGLRDHFNSPFGFEQVEVHSLEGEMDLGLLLDDDDTAKINMTITIESLDDIAFACCFPENTIKSMMDSMGGGGAAPAAPEPKAKARAVEPEIPITPTVTAAPPVSAPPMTMESALMESAGLPSNIELIMDIDLPVVIRLGSTEMTLKEIMRMGPGAIIELNKGVDEPVELMVNDQSIARGEVVVVEGNFAFRVTEIISRQKRIKSLV